MAEQLETVENIRKQYIVVKIGNEQYGIDISYVDNIVRMQKITRVPAAGFTWKVKSHFLSSMIMPARLR